jgi:hypothetical protein
MTQPTSTRTLLTIPFPIPAYWTPEQALAVAELLDDLRELIWAHYGMQLIDEYHEQNMPKSSAAKSEGPKSEGPSGTTPNDTSF